MKASVASVILEQLGGNKFLAMTGAKTLVGVPDGISFKLPSRSKNGINFIRITLDYAWDAYIVEFQAWNWRKGDLLFFEQLQGIHAEDLQRVFTEKTGLDTHL